MAWAGLLRPPNLLDLAIKKEKKLQNKKLWLADQTETKSFPACPTCHSRTVMCKPTKKLKN